MKCKICGNGNATRNRQKTNYYDDECNFEILCPECQEEMDKHWNERWEEYHNTVLD